MNRTVLVLGTLVAALVVLLLGRLVHPYVAGAVCLALGVGIVVTGITLQKREQRRQEALAEVAREARREEKHRQKWVEARSGRRRR